MAATETSSSPADPSISGQVEYGSSWIFRFARTFVLVQAAIMTVVAGFMVAFALRAVVAGADAHRVVLPLVFALLLAPLCLMLIVMARSLSIDRVSIDSGRRVIAHERRFLGRTARDVYSFDDVEAVETTRYDLPRGRMMVVAFRLTELVARERLSSMKAGKTWHRNKFDTTHVLVPWLASRKRPLEAEAQRIAGLISRPLRTSA